MTAGYWYMLISLVSFAGMGIVHKLGDRFHGNALQIALFTMLSSCLITCVITAARVPLAS